MNHSFIHSKLGKSNPRQAQENRRDLGYFDYYYSVLPF